MFELGCRKLNVTPPDGCFLAGYAARSGPSTGVYHPLSASVVALSDDKTSLLLVSIEWLGFYERTPAVRRALEEATGIPEGNVLLLGTHTHCGPAVRGLDDRRHGPGTVDEAYLTSTTERLCEAAVDALADRRRVQLYSASTRCGFAASRRKPDGSGGVVWEPSLDAPHDHEVPILFAKDASGETLLAFFSYACHPTSTGPINEVGGDYPGFAMSYVESNMPGCLAVFGKGCGGDQKPNFLDAETGGFRKAAIPEVRAIGEQLGASVVDGISQAKEVSGPLCIRSEVVELTTDPVDPSAIEELASSGSAIERAWASHYSELPESEHSRQHAVEIQSVTIGSDVAIVSMSGEMSCEYGLRIKKELLDRFSLVMPLGYANAIVGYVPVERQLPELGYEVITNQRALLRTGPFETGTESRIMRAMRATTA